MRETSAFGFPDEWFQGPNLEWGRSKPWFQESSFTEYIEQVKDNTVSVNGVVSTKFMWDTMERFLARVRKENPKLRKLRDRKVIEAVLPNPCYIYLKRQDRVKQAISYVKAQQLDSWIHSQNAHRQNPFNLSFQYEYLKNRGAWLEDGFCEWEKFFEREGIEPLRLVYEECSKRMKQTIEEIADFAGISLEEGYAFKPNVVRKQRDETSHEWYQRFHELEEVREQAPETPPENDPAAAQVTLTMKMLQDGFQSIDEHCMSVVRTEVQNQGNTTLPQIASRSLKGSFAVGVFWKGHGEDEEEYAGRGMLPCDLPPGETAGVEICLPVSPKPSFTPVAIEVRPLFMDQGPLPADCWETVPVTFESLEDRDFFDYFGDLDHISDDIYRHSALGNIKRAEFPWIIHGNHQWLRCYGSGAGFDDFWFYDFRIGLWWTSTKLYPCIYSYEYEAWLKYDTDSQEPWRFYNFKTDEWFEVN